MTGGNRMLGSLQGRSPTLFLVAGALLVVFAANTYLTTFTGTAYPPLHDVVGPAGFFVGILGLFGLYPALAVRAPWSALAALVAAVVPAVGWLLITAGGAGTFVGVLSGEGVLPEVVAIGTIVSTTLAFLLFGATSLRAGVHPRAVGVLLLVPSAMFVLLVARAAPPFVVDTGHVVGVLGIGVALRTAGLPTDRAEPAADATP